MPARRVLTFYFPFMEGPSRARRLRTLARRTESSRTCSNIGETHTAHAEILETYDWDWAQAENEYTKAIEMAPTYGTAYLWYARYLMIQGKSQPALEMSLKAEEV